MSYTNPKIWSKSQSTSLTGFAIEDPIGQEQRDTRLNGFYIGSWKVKFYLGDGLISAPFFRKLATYSHTLGGIIDKIQRFGFQTGYDVIWRKEPYAARGTEKEATVSDQDFDRYVEFLKGNFYMKEIGKAMVHCGKSLTLYGNAWLELTIAEVNGERRARFTGHDFTKGLISDVDLGDGVDYLLLSPHWYSSVSVDSAKVPPRIVPIFPAWLEEKDQATGGTVSRTIFHIKSEEADYDIYSPPFFLRAVYPAHLELLQAQYMAKGFSEDWTGKVFFEIFEGNGSGETSDYLDGVADEDAEVNTGEEGFANKIARVFSRGGERKTILLRNAGEGGKETKVHQFLPNTDHQFHDSTANRAIRAIVTATGWSLKLTGISIPGALGNSTFQEELLMVYHSVIAPLQDVVTDGINEAIQVALEKMGVDQGEFSRYSLAFKNGAAAMLEEITQSKQQPGNAAAPAQPAGPEADTGAATTEPQETVNK